MVWDGECDYFERNIFAKVLWTCSKFKGQSVLPLWLMQENWGTVNVKTPSDVPIVKCVCQLVTTQWEATSTIPCFYWVPQNHQQPKSFCLELRKNAQKCIWCIKSVYLLQKDEPERNMACLLLLLFANRNRGVKACHIGKRHTVHWGQTPHQCVQTLFFSFLTF